MKNGYVSYIADSLSDPEIMNNALRDYLSRSVDGLICQFPVELASNSEILEKIQAFPSKLLITYKELPFPSDQIIHDRFVAMVEMADHFAKTGRRKILVISSSMSNSERIEVFRQRLIQKGIRTLVSKIIDGNASNENLLGQKFVNTLKAEYPKKIPSDAIWCTCDEGAAAVMNFLQGEGYSVPKDIAVVGFNDSEMGNYLKPPLATVQRSDDELVSCAVQTLLDRINKPELPLTIRKYSMKFIARESAWQK
jgi:LacI family transcriptional regulator